MGKVVKAVVGIVATVVGVVTGQWWLVAAGAALTLSSIVKTPKVSSNGATEQRLSKKLEPETFRKIIFGKTAAGADLRYWEVYGSGGNQYVEVIAGATHRVYSYGRHWQNETEVVFSGNNATGALAGALTRRVFLEGQTGSGVNLGGRGLWTTTAAMTGCSYYVLDYVYSQAKLPQGISSRYTQEVEGAFVYDPRRDSTVGGSGSHRINDQTTWAYATTDSNGQPIGRNNALQMLWYQIGWRINGKLVAGKGVDPLDIDLDSFIQAANDCEVMGWYSDCILSTGDSHDVNEGILEAAAEGNLLDTGGRYSYRVAIDDTANVAAYFNEHDIIGEGFDWSPRDPLSKFYNEIAGTFVDPAALYQPRPFPMVWSQAYYDADGRKERDTVALAAVQDAAQAQKLMRIRLNRTRFQGEFTATFNYKAFTVSNYDVVCLSISQFGWVNRLFRVISQGISAMGGIDLTLREESSSIYGAGSVTTLPAPSAGYGMDPYQQISPTNVVDIATGVAGSAGSAVDAIQISYDAPPALVEKVELRYRKVGDTYYSATTLPRDMTNPIIQPLQASTSYEWGIRFISVYAVPGPWATGTRTTNAVTVNRAGAIVYADGTPVETLKPAEGGANVTATHTAAAIAGQAWAATNGAQSRVDNYLVPVGQNAYINSEANGAVHNSAILPLGWAPASDGNVGLTVTRQSIVGARRGAKAYVTTTPANGTFFDAFITPYSSVTLLRRFAMPCKPGDKIGFSMLLALQNATQAYTNVQFYNASGAYVSESAGTSVTNNANGDTAVASDYGTSSGIATAPATAAWALIFTRVICSGATFPAVWCLSPQLCILPANSSVLPPYSPGPPDRTADATSENIAAAVTGQSAWATYTGSIQSVTQPKVNQVFDGGLKLGAKGWGLFSFGYDNNGTYGPLLFTGSPNASAQSDFFKMSPSTQYTASANLGGTFALNQAVMYIQFYNAAKAPLGNSGGIYFLSGVGFPRLTHTYTTPSDAAFGKLIIATASGSVTQVIAFRLKNEFGPEVSPFSDEATSGALYANGIDIDSLRPAELGANVTGTNTAAGIAGQGPGATAAADAVLNANVLAAGPNIVRWSSFERGTENIALGYQPTATSWGIGDNATEYAYASMSAPATGAGTGVWASILFGHPFSSWQQPYQIQGGRRYCIAVRGRAAGGVATIALPRINIWDINRASVGVSYVVTDASINIGGFTYHYCILDIAESATMCSLEVYANKTAAAGAAFYAFDRPMIRQILSQSTAFPGYVNGPNAVAGADPTGQNTAAAIIGQASWATSSVPESRVSKLKNNGRSTSSYQVSNGVLTGATLYRSPVYVLGSADVSGAARITIAASTLRGSGIVVSYAAGTIDGCAYATTYYVWIYDPDVVGGTVSYVATTDPNLYIDNADYLYVGNIRTTAAAGAAPPPYVPPPTPPGYYDCVVASAWLPSQVRAGDIQAGDTVLVLREDGEGSELGKCVSNKTALAPCMRFVTVSGIELTCSTTTPILYKKEVGYGSKPAWECDGTEIVPVIDFQGFRWEALEGQPGHIGSLLVAHISVNDGVYAAGDQRDRFIFTHNIRMDEYVKP